MLCHRPPAPGPRHPAQPPCSTVHKSLLLLTRSSLCLISAFCPRFYPANSIYQIRVNLLPHCFFNVRVYKLANQSLDAERSGCGFNSPEIWRTQSNLSNHAAKLGSSLVRYGKNRTQGSRPPSLKFLPPSLLLPPRQRKLGENSKQLGQD